VTVDYVRGCRYAGVDADHAIVVHTGITSNPAALDRFCAHHADRGVDVWTPDERFRFDGSAEGLVALGTDVAETSSLPVFLVGSALSATAIYRTLQVSDVFFGAVLISDVSPPVSPESLDPSLRQNTKPVLWIIGGTDVTSGSAAARPGVDPVEVQRHPDAVDRLMLSHPEACSDAVLEWCLRQLSNHHNPTWRFE
jgi:pimeloyl-ACP methyl ester carboxylesterase